MVFYVNNDEIVTKIELQYIIPGALPRIGRKSTINLINIIEKKKIKRMEGPQRLSPRGQY